MAGAESAAGARADGLLSSLKRLVATLVAIGQTRLELLSVELQAERRRLDEEKRRLEDERRRLDSHGRPRGREAGLSRVAGRTFESSS